jgi:hypothetical protein
MQGKKVQGFLALQQMFTSDGSHTAAAQSKKAALRLST